LLDSALAAVATAHAATGTAVGRGGSSKEPFARDRSAPKAETFAERKWGQEGLICTSRPKDLGEVVGSAKTTGRGDRFARVW